MVYIFCKHHSPRHDYTFQVIFQHWMGLEYQQIDDISSANLTKGFLINYSDKPSKQGIWIPEEGLLSQQGLQTEEPQIGKFQQVPVLFPTIEKKASLPYDIFSATFYLLSRYEEYLPFKADIHGRFEADQSLQFRHGFHHIPVVDFWLKQLESLITKQHRGTTIKSHEFTFTPTYDIDQFWAYLHKGTWRNTAGYLRDWFNGSAIAPGLRKKVLQKKVSDPFDAYSYLEELHSSHKLSAIFFVHPGTYGPYDKNIKLTNKFVREIITSLSLKNEVALHPSYKSANNEPLFRHELEELSSLLGKKITHCRQHFLKIKLPDTYRMYISAGITDDYSLGWATDIGFRAGTSRSFPFYDLEKESITSLMLHPLCMMEGALKSYRKLRPYEARMELESMIHLLHEVNGTLLSLWHNESLGNNPQWSGWREVYEFMIQRALTRAAAEETE